MEIANTYVPSLPTQSPGSRLMAVLTVDVVGDRAVYLGIVQLPDGEGHEAARAECAEWVARHGVKQSYKSALNYFPHLEVESYRP